jgi:hypothetical protein
MVGHVEARLAVLEYQLELAAAETTTRIFEHAFPTPSSVCKDTSIKRHSVRCPTIVSDENTLSCKLKGVDWNK